MSNVIDIRTGKTVEPGINTLFDGKDRTDNVPPPEQEEVCNAVKQYRADLEQESQASGPGWGSAILAGLGLNVLGIF